VKWRDRFVGGSTTHLPEKRYGSVKAVDPLTGETKAQFKMQYPNWGGTLATAGNLVFNAQSTACSTRLMPRHCSRSGASMPAPASPHADHLFGQRQAIYRGAGRIAADLTDIAEFPSSNHVGRLDAVRVRALSAAALARRGHNPAPPAKALWTHALRSMRRGPYYQRLTPMSVLPTRIVTSLLPDLSHVSQTS